MFQLILFIYDFFICLFNLFQRDFYKIILCVFNFWSYFFDSSIIFFFIFYIDKLYLKKIIFR